MKARCTIDVDLETGAWKISWKKLGKSKEKINHTKFLTAIYKALLTWQDRKTQPEDKEKSVH